MPSEKMEAGPWVAPVGLADRDNRAPAESVTEFMNAGTKHKP
jgi:hypothetical protein